jgi:hypothetical protein
MEFQEIHHQFPRQEHKYPEQNHNFSNTQNVKYALYTKRQYLFLEITFIFSFQSWYKSPTFRIAPFGYRLN